MSCDTNKTQSTALAAAFELEEQTHITCKPDVSGSLHDKYLKAQDGSGNKHIFVMKVDTDPTTSTLAGYTKVDVAISENATEEDVAEALATAADGLDGYHASSDGDEVTLTNDKCAAVEAVSDGESSAGTGFTIKQCQVGGYDELGLTEGDTEFSGFEPDVQDVLAHQLGSTPAASINKGVNPAVSLVLLETDESKRKLLFSSIGGEVEYNNVKGYGVGTGKVGGLLNTFSRRLRFYNYANPEDKSQHITFWKAVIYPDTLTFSTENPDKFSVNFKFYPNLGLPAEVKDANIVYFGDPSSLVPVVAEIA